MKKFGFVAALALSCAAPAAQAQISGDIVRVGVLNDISGIFQDTNGMGSVEAARMAAEDFGGGGKDWYFITVNFALGQGIEAEATSYIEKHGGKVLGSAKHPLGTSDFASLLLQAQSSKAKVIGLANAGGDTINAVKQASEFGIQQGGQTMVAFLLFVNDVHGMGLKVAQGLQLLEAFYWDMDDDTRAFAKRFAARPGMNGKMPSGNQAGVYASTLAYLNAVAATGSDDAKDVVPQMKKFKGKDK